MTDEEILARAREVAARLPELPPHKREQLRAIFATSTPKKDGR